MNNKALTLSLLMAVLAVFFVQSYVTSIEDEAKKKFGTEIMVIAARRDIKEMETVTEAALEFKTIPKRFLEPAAIYFEKREEDKETTTGMKRLMGTIAVVPIRKGEQLSWNKLSEPNARTGLAPQVAPGRRAMSLPINDITGVSKLLKPGDRVDLIGIFEQYGPNGQSLGKGSKSARTVLQDVVVLATGHNVTNNVARTVESDPFGGKERFRSLAEDTSFNSVTVELEPAQAQALALILSNGDSSIFISLRNNDDTERNPLPPTGVGDLFVGGARLPAGDGKR